MSTNHNRIRVADLETNQPNKILKTNAKGELEFSDANNQTENYNALDCTTEGKALDARQGKVLKDMIDLKPVDLASDAETQISAVVSEDKKVVSRLKLFNWWQWIIRSPLKWYNTITLNQGNSKNVPLIIPTGVLTTTPIVGAIETDSKSIYYTSYDGIRKNLSDKAIFSNTTLSLNHFGQGFIGAQEFITPLVTNSKLFNNGTNQYDVYSIFSTLVISNWYSPVTSIKLELQINVSNSAYPETWYTMAAFEANRNDLPSGLPLNVILSANLTTSIIGDKYLFFSGTDTSLTKNNTIQGKTNNLAIGSQPLKQDMLVSIRIKSNLMFNTNTTYQQFYSSIPLFQVEKKQS